LRVPDDRDKRKPITPPAGVRAQIAVPTHEFDQDDVTGKYTGIELEQRRQRRTTEERLNLADHARDDIRELRADAKRVGEKVAGHHEAIESTLKPLAAKLPGQLEDIRVAQAALNAAVEAAVMSSQEITASISLQLRGHHERIEDVEETQRASTAQLASVEKTATEARSMAHEATARITKLEIHRSDRIALAKQSQRFWQRHLDKLITAVIGAITGGLAALLGGH
jgi:hypothetical protein